MKAGTFVLSFAIAIQATAMTPPGLIPSNTENMTAFFNTSILATNGAPLLKHIWAVTPRTMALDKQLTGVTFMVVMIDPDAPSLGLGVNGSQAFLHWMQNGLTSAATNVTIQGKTVFPLVNAANITAIQSYQLPTPPSGVTRRYMQYLLATTGVTGFAVSQAVGDAVTSRIAFSMQDFATQANVTIASANFMNITGT